jgi:hypothetical protein
MNPPFAVVTTVLQHMGFPVRRLVHPNLTVIAYVATVRPLGSLLFVTGRLSA